MPRPLGKSAVSATAISGRRKKLALLTSLGIIASLCSGCAPAAVPTSTSRAGAIVEQKADDALVQFSLIAALAAGDYADGIPLQEVLTSGDFGLGTFDRLEGEMIVLDGQMYQALADGTLRAANLDSTTPFAEVKFFREDGRAEHMAARSLEDLDEQLDRMLKRRNVPYALRLDGHFSALTLRSVPAQTPPFQPLVNVVKHQSTWPLKDVTGTLIGFRCPPWVGTLNVPGYHWHFLSEDRTLGGHVLNCEFADGLLQFDECEAVTIRLSDSAGFDAFDVNSVGKQDINAIERQRKEPASK